MANHVLEMHRISGIFVTVVSRINGGRLLYQYNKYQFLLKFQLLTSFFRITSLQAMKEKLF